jgi:Mrp family chromosome partitioning ATPase
VPDKPLLLSIALFGSLIVGLGAAIGRDVRFGGFSDAASLESGLGLPVLATLPRIDRRTDLGAGERQRTTEVLDHPDSAYSEAMRLLLLNLGLIEPVMAGPARVILVASLLPGEGKTLTALSLARLLGLQGRRTLLIDGNRRDPALDRLIGIERSRDGTARLSRLDGEAAGAAPVTDIAPNLAILSGFADGRTESAVPGTDPFAPWRRLEHVLERARPTYDIIVIDGAPWSAQSDARMLARYADDILLVIRAGSTRRAAAADFRAGQSRYGDIDKSFGAILNGTFTKSAYHG